MENINESLQEVQQEPINLQVKIPGDTDINKARQMVNGMQRWVNNLGVDQCLEVLDQIERHPSMFMKALKMMHDPVVSNMIKNFLR